jgi:hypothetical protein
MAVFSFPRLLEDEGVFSQQQVLENRPFPSCGDLNEAAIFLAESNPAKTGKGTQTGERRKG